MKSLRKWLDNHIARLNCFVNGHGPFFVLEVYETKEVLRFFRGNALQKIRVEEPRKLTYEYHKVKCLKCQRISLEWTLIGATAHTNTEPDA